MTDLKAKYAQQLESMMKDAQENLKEAVQVEDMSSKELSQARENLRKLIKASKKRRFFGEAFKLIWFSIKRKQTLEIPKLIVKRLQEFIKMKESLPVAENDVREKMQLVADAKNDRIRAENCVAAIETLQNGGEISKPKNSKRKK